MRPIATPMAASGFSPRAIALLGDRLGALGLAPMAGRRGVQNRIIKRRGRTRPFLPGSPP